MLIKCHSPVGVRDTMRMFAMRLLPICCREHTPRNLMRRLACLRRIAHKATVLLTVVLSLASVQHLPAGLLPGNFWPNPTLETDANSDGVPDFWHKGGSSTAIDLWTTSL